MDGINRVKRDNDADDDHDEQWWLDYLTWWIILHVLVGWEIVRKYDDDLIHPLLVHLTREGMCLCVPSSLELAETINWWELGDN